MADSNVNIRINATNAASHAINQVKRDLGGLDKAAGTATGGISALAKVAGAAGLVAFGVQAAGAAVELAKLGSASIAMKASFEQMAGGAENAASILDALTTASRGTISQYDLMLTANRSMLLGVADSAEEFSQLMQIATVRGRAMGLSTTQAFNDIVTGLGRALCLPHRDRANPLPDRRVFVAVHRPGRRTARLPCRRAGQLRGGRSHDTRLLRHA